MGRGRLWRGVGTCDPGSFELAGMWDVEEWQRGDGGNGQGPDFRRACLQVTLRIWNQS